MFTIGCHLPTKKGFLHMAQETVSMQGNTFQYFTRNPRGGHIKEIDPTDIAAYKAYADQHDIKPSWHTHPMTLSLPPMI